jgi:hypothetical protein
MGPLLGANGVPVQGIHDGIAVIRIFLITGREIHDYIAIDSIAFEIAL